MLFEVSSLAARTMLTVADAAGLPRAAVLAGLSFDGETLIRRRRVRWDDFCVLCERIEAGAGGPDAWEPLLCAALPTAVPRELGWIVAGLVNPKLHYRLIFGVINPVLFPALDVGCDALRDGRLRIYARLRAGARPSAAFFRGSAATLYATVVTLGVPRPIVAIEELHERAGVALVTVLEPDRSARATGGPRVSWPMLARRGRELFQHLMTDVRSLFDDASDRGGSVADLRALGQRLATQGSRRELGAAVVEALMDLGCTAVVLVARDGDGLEARIASAGPDDAPRTSNELRVGGRVVGRLEVAGSSRVVADLAPWIGLALAHAAADADAGAPRRADPHVEERVAQASLRLELTERQSAVLREVVRGHANKEIAATLGLAENTVEFHLTHIMRKARVQTRTQLAARFWAGELGGPGP